jgi:hypothetical protein
MSTKTKRIIGWVLTGLIAALMVFSAFMKLKGGPEMEANLKGSLVTVDVMRNIGIVELLCVILWLIPRTGVAGTLLMVSYLGGAIYSSISTGQSFAMAAGVCALVWVASALRFPELTQRLFGK